jgi:hypothetical protein
MDALVLVAMVALYLLAGRVLYRRRWPDGLLSPEDNDDTLERLRRIGRRRVQPVPDRHGGER